MTPFEIEQLWLEYHPKVYGYFYRRLSNRLDVEDLTSVTLTVFIDKLSDNQNQIQSPHGYLWKIAHNQMLKFITTKSKQPIYTNLDENFDLEEEKVENYRSEHLEERLQHLMNCVKNHLTGQDYLIVENVIMQDKKAVDVAKELNLKPDNVRQKLSRNLKKLREKCKQLWND